MTYPIVIHTLHSNAPDRSKVRKGPYFYATFDAQFEPVRRVKNYTIGWATVEDIDCTLRFPVIVDHDNDLGVSSRTISPAIMTWQIKFISARGSFLRLPAILPMPHVISRRPTLSNR